MKVTDFNSYAKFIFICLDHQRSSLDYKVIHDIIKCSILLFVFIGLIY